MAKEQPPVSAITARYLMLVLGAVWVSIGLMIITKVHPAMHVPAPWNVLMAGGLIAAGFAALGLALLLGRRSRLGFFASLAFLAASALAVVFDQVGAADLMFVVANVIALILLLNARLWYLRT